MVYCYMMALAPYDQNAEQNRHNILKKLTGLIYPEIASYEDLQIEAAQKLLENAQKETFTIKKVGERLDQSEGIK